MKESDRDSRGDGLPIAPSMDVAAAAAGAPGVEPVAGHRLVTISALAIGLGTAGGVIAWLLLGLIALITNGIYGGRLDARNVEIPLEAVGWTVLFIPLLGAIVIGLMARFGSPAIRGHGIPEVMDKVLHGQSRIPPRLMFLKPLSAAIAIGTGGPFGAEGPIIATGGALGSWVGQVVKVTADERKILLAAGAAAGMAATFGSPVSAVLLAIELLLFEYRARSLIAVSLAAAAATSVRMAFAGSAPVFPLGAVLEPGSLALTTYIALGALLGVASVYVTRLVYAIEDRFERLPVHWMWWPALGGVAVGVIGYFAPRTLGVGYVNIEQTVRGELAGQALLILCLAKLASWSIALGSGTSGGTLAPLLTIGGAIGALVTALIAQVFPGHAIDPRIGALVGMAAMFAGASRALLASVVFAFECTRQPIGLLPLLGGCAASYFVSCLLMPSSIMTEKLVRRGLRVRSEYQVDFLDSLLVGDHATRDLVTLDARCAIDEARALLARESHQGFPVVEDGALKGVLTRRELLEPSIAAGTTLGALVKRTPIVVNPEHSLREAADHMVAAGIGRVIVVERDAPQTAIGILTRSDLLVAHAHRLHARGERTA